MVLALAPACKAPVRPCFAQEAIDQKFPPQDPLPE
jgi:hypothetical protein